jgi:hypothetical protein
MLVKLLGAIDVASSLAFLLMIFGIHPWIHYILFCSGLLFLKGLFIFTGDVLSVIDLVAFVTLIVSIFFIPGTILLWTLSFLLLAKGFVSFL